jgi:outer membrane lipoprotein SlyB
LVAVTANGTTYNVETAPVEKQGASQGKSTAKKVAVGSAAGAALGGILGRGIGAGIGAAIGAAGGAAEQGLSHAKRVKIESEERLDFALRSPITIQAPGSTKP